MDIKSKLEDWINKTGYPLELKTESILFESDYNIINSHIYHDTENSIYRELDLFATKYWGSDNKLGFNFNLIIECKKSTKPFLLLTKNSSKLDNFSLGEIYGIDDIMSRIMLSGSPRTISLPEKTGYGFKLIQGFTTSDETIYKAINTIIKSYNYYQENENENETYNKEENLHSIGIPLLIIDAPFFSLYIDKNSGVVINDIECGILRVKTHLSRFEHEPVPIIIIQNESIIKLLKSIDEFGESFYKYLISNPEYNINNIDNLEIELVEKKNKD